jgi:hypothetical protein
MYYLIDPIRLKAELFEYKNYTREVTGGDAGSNTSMYLVKVSTFKTWGLHTIHFTIKYKKPFIAKRKAFLCSMN